MKNLALAGSFLIIVLIAVFFFTSKYKAKNDILIPEQKDLGSPPVSIVTRNNDPRQATNAAMKKQYAQAPAVLSPDKIKGKKARISTSKGEIVFAFYEDAPRAASNYIFLANDHFYDGLIFHRVIKGFMIQGGDPLGNGTGNPGYSFEDELDPETSSFQTGYVRGVVAMANAGPNTNGSQFFIMQRDNNLPHNYTIFGHVISGLEVVDAIADSQVGNNDRPVEPVVMGNVRIED